MLSNIFAKIEENITLSIFLKKIKVNQIECKFPDKETIQFQQYNNLEIYLPIFIFVFVCFENHSTWVIFKIYFVLANIFAQIQLKSPKKNTIILRFMCLQYSHILLKFQIGLNFMLDFKFLIFVFVCFRYLPNRVIFTKIFFLLKLSQSYLL